MGTAERSNLLCTVHLVNLLSAWRGSCCFFSLLSQTCQWTLKMLPLPHFRKQNTDLRCRVWECVCVCVYAFVGIVQWTHARVISCFPCSLRLVDRAPTAVILMRLSDYYSPSLLNLCPLPVHSAAPHISVANPGQTGPAWTYPDPHVHKYRHICNQMDAVAF